MESEIRHISVLLDEVISFLVPKDKGIYIDATLGGGGHAEKILEMSGPSGRLIGIETDPNILSFAIKRLERFGNRCDLVENNYIEMPRIIEKLGIEKIDGIVFDLGVNLEHFVNPERGFSVLHNGPLDMRFSPKTKITAEDIVNNWKAEDLLKILYRYGEEKYAKKIVRALVDAREKKKISTTGALSELIVKAIGRNKSGGIHPATRTFQALRIAVNGELSNIETVLPQSVDILKPGGRICVISFHSLEDRLVKNIFRLLATGCICPPEIGLCVCSKQPKIKIITRKPISPGEDELAHNASARSAKLRVAEKI